MVCAAKKSISGYLTAVERVDKFAAPLESSGCDINPIFVWAMMQLLEPCVSSSRTFFFILLRVLCQPIPDLVVYATAPGCTQ